ncbi:secondary thiamine-phosphate synthase enzyme YjbQ [Vibrio sp. JC009]|uniref:secondary thiamine-phosphate synthase enzyme YjbQ n=1 Tax=Vibrio sp. JC009 TaxID=2912314 RepID=UPI0023B0CEED|nr:secondary thiamine-phosphate synthase enzyme YjbQ [Vibrio sp. JC009]WED23439.1 secondary thiamine-phosphate synthase enzyme YjbQ [Vibrio sp. JC009]
MLKRTELSCATLGRDGFTDITEQVSAFIHDESGEAIVQLFLPHTTAGLVISDKMDTVTKDTQMIFSRLFPEKDDYVHRSPNSDAHVKSVLCGCELTVPVKDGELLLGEWQRIFVVEGDGPKENRKVICSYIH